MWSVALKGLSIWGYIKDIKASKASAIALLILTLAATGEAWWTHQRISKLENRLIMNAQVYDRNTLSGFMRDMYIIRYLDRAVKMGLPPIEGAPPPSVLLRQGELEILKKQIELGIIPEIAPEPEPDVIQPRQKPRELKEDQWASSTKAEYTSLDQ